MAAGANGGRTLEETPTWAVAAVCAVIVVISVIIEHGIHSLAKWFQKKHRKAMLEALEKIKAELMLLGFISLLLTVGQQKIAKICIPSQAGKVLLPCKKAANSKEEGDDKNNGRKLLWYGGDLIWRRALAEAAGEGDYCAKRGDKVSLITQYALHQLHIFIFVLAVFHVLYSVLTMALAQAKMKKWKKWEQETASLEYQFANDPARFRFTHQTSFVKQHAGLSQTPGIRWIVAFFRQFIRSVTKVDYLTMRHGFINAHLAPNSKFNFHKYIKRALEDDFKVVVGVSIPLWLFAIIFMLVNVYAWYTLFWISFIPLAILLLVGMKLEVVIMEMAHQVENRTAVVKGVPIVEPSDRLFWFNRPEWILFLIHFTLFQNAFQMAFFLWVWFEFGLTSCYHDNLGISLARVFLGLVLQFLCSYVTFPLYALVTQMGSHMKKAIFEEQTAKALMKWRKQAKERKKKMHKGGVDSSSGFIGSENTPSHNTSPLHLLHKHKAHSADLESAPTSPRSYQSDTDLSEPDSSIHGPHGNYDPTRHDQSLPKNGEDYSHDFSFSQMAKP